ncbi:MAG TPA: hypothetical protein VNZ06_00495 [Steroidobacteraceae bacterium]|jgi:hypothetical protein|nr:hypothetical protein [Steroidobacteraceae bacterium]
MSDLAGFEDLIARLARSSRLSERETTHVVEEVLAFLNDSIEQFVRRRHRELQREGLRNPQIYLRVAQEALQRRFRTEALSTRQIRRLVYG